MLMSGYPGAARGRYQAVDVDSRIESASPHKLIAILFDELIKAIEIMQAAQSIGNRAKMIDKQQRAANILLALETSLDFRGGGDLAITLAQVYREGRRLVQQGGREDRPEMVEEARSMLAEIASAWEQIG
ncbi:flagellar export chaperone FliS [Sphingomonas montanisoli]|uniref:Flagellar protein FliS n=1 Tax=Sphingomonas montanisoli TaxID=2606412 RepID=A0A5D9CCF8_9SPHN|nr:flagellar protein FliS [Sphingomonas montanisoli]TZG28943.1 flagellar protein FliS [Sphingomonas montanisoli]